MISGSGQFDLEIVLYAATVFFIGGLVKGVAGFGLPLTTVPLLALVAPVQSAIGWTLLPLLISQIVQLIECRDHATVLRTIWPLIFSLTLSLALSVQLLAVFNAEMIMVLIGIMIQLFVLTQLLPQPLHVPVKCRAAILFAGGCLSGGLGGMTGLYGFPATQMLIALELTSRAFIFATSATFVIATVIMAVGLDRLELLGRDDVVISAVSVVPTLLAMVTGRIVRGRLSVRVFQLGVLLMISLTGWMMIARAWL